MGLCSWLLLCCGCLLCCGTRHQALRSACPRTGRTEMPCFADGHSPLPLLQPPWARAVLKYFIAQREKEIADGTARKVFKKAQNAGMTPAGAKPPVAGAGVRVLEGLAASGLRAIRCGMTCCPAGGLRCAAPACCWLRHLGSTAPPLHSQLRHGPPPHPTGMPRSWRGCVRWWPTISTRRVSAAAGCTARLCPLPSPAPWASPLPSVTSGPPNKPHPPNKTHSPSPSNPACPTPLQWWKA